MPNAGQMDALFTKHKNHYFERGQDRPAFALFVAEFSGLAFFLTKSNKFFQVAVAWFDSVLFEKLC
jgi:general stress protein 26